MTPLVFGDTPEEFSGYDQAQAVILPIPYEQTTSFLKGTAQGPHAILNAASQIELFDEKLKTEPFRIGIHVLPFMAISPDLEKFLSHVETEVFFHLKQNKLVIMLGGEHTLTIGGVKAAKKLFPNVGVVQIDAHADLRDSYQNNPFSHACAMRRILDYAPLFQIGIRSLSKEEFNLIQERKITTLFSHELSDQNLDSFVAKLPEDIYLTIDLDGFDPAVVPGVGNPEPGGLNWEMADHIFEQISARSKIRAFDIVELRPLADEARSEITAARLLYRILGYSARDQVLPNLAP
jgi:agmatinase